MMVGEHQVDGHTLRTLMRAEHADPFSVLGMHRSGSALVVRALLPLAERVSVLDDAGRPCADLTRQDGSDLFTGVIPQRQLVFDYQLQVQWREPDGGLRLQVIEDAYRFGPQLGETDVWLLAEGTHHRPFEQLGAHPCSVGDIHGTRFAVWAPQALRVSVVGNFNNWDGRRHMMRLRKECGVWEIFIPLAGAGDCYKFEVLGEDGVNRLKSDPFGFGSQLRPETASVVRPLPSLLAPAPERAQRNARDAAISIYEVHVGSWRRHADGRWLSFRELADQLVPYAQSLGFTHLQFLPVNEHPYDPSWGYQPVGLYAPTSRFGSPEDLRHLIATAHEAGLGVILDWVPAHFPTDAHGLAQFDGSALYEYADPREGFHQDWNTLIYNYARTEVRNFLVGNALYWLERFGADGLRVDAVASMLYRDYSRKSGEWVPNREGGRENLEAIDFLRRMNHIVGTQRAGAITVAEESTTFAGVTRPPSDDMKSGGLGFHYKWNMGWMNDTLAYFARDPVYRRHHHDQIRFSMMYAFTENFVLPISHDEVVHGKGSLLRKMPGDDWQKFANLRAMYGFMWGHPGKKLLFMGCEFGQWDEWNANTSLQWHLLEQAPHSGLQRLVRDLNRVLQHFPALHQLDCESDGFRWISHEDAAQSVLAFERRSRSGQVVVVVCNLTPVVRHGYRVGVPEFGLWREIINTDAHVYGGSGVGSGALETDALDCHGHGQSLNLTLPPLATLMLVRDEG